MERFLRSPYFTFVIEADPSLTKVRHDGFNLSPFLLPLPKKKMMMMTTSLKEGDQGGRPWTPSSPQAKPPSTTVGVRSSASLRAVSQSHVRIRV